MTKADFVDVVAEKAGLGKKDAQTAVDAVLETLTEKLSEGTEVTFSGFGKFHVTERQERQGVNPATGQKITIAAKKLPKFSAGASLKKAVG